MKLHADLTNLAEQLTRISDALFAASEEAEELQDSAEDAAKLADSLAACIQAAFDVPFYDQVRGILTEVEGEERVWRIRDLIEARIDRMREVKG